MTFTVPRIRQGGTTPAGSGGRPPAKASGSSGWWPGYMRGEASPIFRGWHPMPRDPADEVRAAWVRAAGRAVDVIHNSGCLPLFVSKRSAITMA
ncbi:hypothetical protein [Methylobacterium indicum]|uniref:hypothetical protein n=1 Tax=Methylobacterium indicum TaxID=1775910 RepID=UPI00073447C8|nr:hypothetical protein [Methylobacterium indicum]